MRFTLATNPTLLYLFILILLGEEDKLWNSSHVRRDTEPTCEFMIYRYIKFRLPNSNSSLNISIRAKGKYRFNASPMLLFAIRKKNKSFYIIKMLRFFEGLLEHRPAGPYICAGFAWEFRAAVLVLLMAEI